jgi:cell division ATPase FtsA
MSPTLAIDFGSSRTKVAYFCPDTGKPKIIELGQEIRAIIPSVFYIPQQGPVLIGDDAAQMADEDPSGIVTDIKRELHRTSKIRCGEGRPAYQRWELVSHLFSEIRRRCGEEVFHTGPSSDCILTVPVCFSEPQRQKLREAAEHAGFTNVRLLEEPVAAAMHWLSGSGKSVSDHVIVVDIGGGTTDLAALKLSGEIYEQIPDLPSSGFACGGNDIDEDVRRALQKDLACNAEDSGGLLLKLRQIKERLIKMDRDVFTISVSGKAQTIQRDVVQSAVQTLVEKTSNEVARFLKDFEDVTGRRDTPVLLAGGGSKLKGMREALKEIAGADRVFIWNDGEYAISLGAALFGVSRLQTNSKPSISGNSAEYQACTKGLREEVAADEIVFRQPIIPQFIPKGTFKISSNEAVGKELEPPEGASAPLNPQRLNAEPSKSINPTESQQGTKKTTKPTLNNNISRASNQLPVEVDNKYDLIKRSMLAGALVSGAVSFLVHFLKSWIFFVIIWGLLMWFFLAGGSDEQGAGKAILGFENRPKEWRTLKISFFISAVIVGNFVRCVVFGKPFWDWSPFWD